jgi:hypothetical protein
VAKRTVDWFRTSTWPITAGAESMPMAGKPHLLSRRTEAADPRDFDPQCQGKGVFTASFAVGPVWVSVEFGDFSGHLEPIRVEVRGYSGAKDDSAFPVTASTLRHIQLSHLVAAALEQHEDLVKDVLAHSKTRRPNRERLEWLDQERRRAASADRASGTRRGRRPVETTQEFWDVLDAYIAACDAPNPTPIIDAAKKVFGSADSSNKAKVVKYVARARKRKIMLAPTTRGVSSGKLITRPGSRKPP